MLPWFTPSMSRMMNLFCSADHVWSLATIAWLTSSFYWTLSPLHYFMLYIYIFLDHRLHILPRMMPSRMVMERPVYLVTCPYQLNVLFLSIASMHNVFLLSSEIQGVLLASQPVTCVHHVSDRNLPTSNIKTYIFSYYQWKYSKFN